MAIALSRTVETHLVTEWTMSRGEAQVKCVRRETDAGVELSVTFSGLRTAQFVAPTVDDARARVDEIRRSWEALGYVAA